MRSAHLELHIAVFLFGISGLFGKLIAASPGVIVFGRTAFAALTILFGMSLFRMELAPSSRRTFLFMLLSGGILALHWLTFFHAIQLSTVAVGLIGYSTFPVFVTIFEPLFFAERYRGMDIFSCVLVATGLFLVAPLLDFSNTTTIGLFWAVVSGGLYAVLALMNRSFVATDSFMVVAFYQHAAAALCLLPFMVHAVSTVNMETILLLLFLGVVCTALAQSLFIKSLKELKAQLASVVAALEPLYGIVFAALLLGEIPGWRTIAGAALVLAAVMVAMRAHAGERG